jgi:TRAP-type C4-dicarboxylate transport system substrate-binding protein
VEPIELTVSNIQPPASTATILLEEWMQAVTDGSEGKVTFDYYGDATLHPANEAVSAMQSGLTDVSFTSNSYWPDQLPVSTWDDELIMATTVGLGYPNVNVSGSAAQLAHYSRDSAVLQETTANGFRPILPMMSGPSSLICTEPFTGPNDLAGRQVRVASPAAQAEAEALGMVGVFMAPNEQYEALQRGVIDCAINAPTTVLGASLLEVAPYTTFADFKPTPGANFSISSATWEELPEPVQQLMFEARYAPTAGFVRNNLDTYKKYVAEVESAGGELVHPEQLNTALANARDAESDIASQAPAAMTDTEAYVAETEKIQADFATFTSDTLGVKPAEGDFEAYLTAWSQGSEGIDWDAWQQNLADYVNTMNR